MKPFQFSLRQLFVAMGIIGVFSAPFYWLGPAFGVLSLGTGTAIACGICLASSRRFAEATCTVLICIVLTVLIIPVFQSPGLPYSIGRCRNNLHCLALALQQYHDHFGSFPPAYTADQNGRPMHSWRVLLLPYVELKSVYQRYNFDEPWDGPNNSALAAQLDRLPYYQCPRIGNRVETSYVAITGQQTMWPGQKTTRLSDIKDGAANSIILVEVHNSGIHWMEPRDLDFSQMNMAVNTPVGQSISSGHLGNFAHVVFASGEVRTIDGRTSSKALRAAMTIAGGEKEKLPPDSQPR